LTHPSGYYSAHNISALKGCCAIKFLHALEIDQALIAHTQLGRGPQKNSNRENLKFALKFGVCTHPYNFGVSVNILNILMRLFQPTCREAGVITCVQFLEGPPPKIWEGQKNVRISARFLTTFDFDREYLRNVWAHQKAEKYLINHNSFQVGQKKPGELWSTYEKVIVVHIDPPKWTFFGTQYFGL